MARVTKALNSSIGSKVLMSLTGLAMVGFLFGHLTGNLLVFLGPDAINDYTENLHSLPALVWGTRFIMLGAILVHIMTAKKLTALNRQASPEKYAVAHSVTATKASRTMAPSGIFIFIYIAYHLAHYTFKVTNPEFSKLGHFDTYSMMMLGFQTWWISAFYIAAIVSLGFHLSHGFKSAFQTLGLNHHKYQKLINLSGPAVSVIISGGFISIPLAIMLGVIK